MASSWDLKLSLRLARMVPDVTLNSAPHCFALPREAAGGAVVRADEAAFRAVRHAVPPPGLPQPTVSLLLVHDRDHCERQRVRGGRQEEVLDVRNPVLARLSHCGGRGRLGRIGRHAVMLLARRRARAPAGHSGQLGRCV